MSDDHFPLQAPAVNPRTVILIVLAVATALMVAVAVRLDRLSYYSYLQDLRLEQTVELMEAREGIEQVVFDHFLLLQRFSTYIRNNPLLTQEEFGNIAATLHRAAPDVVNFAAETDLVVEYVHPFEENRSVLGLDYRHLPTQLPSVLKAIEERTGILSGPFDLVQGGRGFVLYTPLYREQDGTRVFDGFLQGVFRVEPLMLQLLTQIDREAFNLELLENSHSLFRHGAADTDMRHSLQLGLSLLNNQDFSLRLSPTEQLLDQPPHPGLIPRCIDQYRGQGPRRSFRQRLEQGQRRAIERRRHDFFRADFGNG